MPEYKGDWWLPNEKDSKVKGTLVIPVDDRPVLELMGALTDIGPGKSNDFRPEVILGTSIEGKRVTLLRCFQFDPTVNLGTGAKSSKFYATIIVVGEHFNDAKELKFKALYAEYAGLDDWVRMSGFDIQTPDPTTSSVIYKQPGPIQAVINGLQVSIIFEGLMHQEIPKRVTIRQRTSIEMRTSAEESIDEFLKLAYTVQNFLSLALAQATYPTEIYGEAELHKVEFQGHTIYPPIRLIIPAATSSKRLGPIPQKPLLLFSDVAGRFSLILKNWFANAELLEPVYAGYFAVMNDPQMYLHQKFLSLVNAIESYHRRRFGNYELPEGDHEKRKQAIVSAAPAEFQKWLTKKLRYSNELTLRVRLEQLVQKFSFLEFKNKDWFINKVLNTRNYLTHYDPSLKDQSATDSELLEITYKLKVMNEAALLTELGLASADVERVIRMSDGYRLAFVSLQNHPSS